MHEVSKFRKLNEINQKSMEVTIKKQHAFIKIMIPCHRKLSEIHQELVEA